MEFWTFESGMPGYLPNMLETGYLNRKEAAERLAHELDMLLSGGFSWRDITDIDEYHFELNGSEVFQIYFNDIPPVTLCQAV